MASVMPADANLLQQYRDTAKGLPDHQIGQAEKSARSSEGINGIVNTTKLWLGRGRAGVLLLHLYNDWRFVHVADTYAPISYSSCAGRLGATVHLR
jgi:hypothetical protein